MSPKELISPTRWLRNQEQLDCVRAVVQSLADDSDQEEYRTMMRLWWQLNMNYAEVDLYRLLTTVRSEKLRAVGELLIAYVEGHEAIDAWVERWSPLIDSDDASAEYTM
jgi:hypothetical protein